MKKYAFIIVGLIAILAIFFTSKKSTAKQTSSNDSKTQTKAALRSGDSDIDSIARKTRIPKSQLNACVLDLLTAFESKDKDLIRKKVLEWLEKDEAMFLKSMESFDALDQVYGFGMVIPIDAVSDFLFEKHGGEQTLEKLALLNRHSFNVGEVTGSIVGMWGKKDLTQVFDYFKKNPNFDNLWAATELGRTQAEGGDPAKVIDYFSKFDDNPELKQAIINTTYETWVGANPEAFATHINSLADTSAASSAIQVYATSAAKEDPLAAIDWADSIKDESTRVSAKIYPFVELALNHGDKFQEQLSKQSFSNNEERDTFIQNIASAIEITKSTQDTQFDTEKWFNDIVEFNRTNDPATPSN